MAHDYTVGEGDLEAPISVPGGLQDENGVIDLTGSTVSFLMRRHASDLLVINAVATVDNALLGIVHYDWVVGDTDTPGQHWAQWRVVLSSGRPIRVPNDGGYEICIQPAVGP